MKLKLWGYEEIIFLVCVYFASEFRAGDDSSPECLRIAACLGRSPASVDRQWRNIHDVRTGKNISNVGKLVIRCTLTFMEDPKASRLEGFRAAEKNGWPTELMERRHGR